VIALGEPSSAAPIAVGLKFRLSAQHVTVWSLRTTHPVFSAPLTKMAEHFKRRGILLLISDFYDEPDAILEAIKPLRFLGNEPGSLPNTEHVAEENFSVPLWPGMPAEAQERVVDVVRSAVGVGARA